MNKNTITLIFLISLVCCKSKDVNTALSIDDITADNFNQKLEIYSEGLLPQDCFGITQIPGIGKIFNNHYKLISLGDWEVTHHPLDETKHTDLINGKRNIQISIHGPKDGVRIFGFHISCFHSPCQDEFPEIENTISYLLREEGFTYKKSILKGGWDMLIKKENNVFAVFNVVLGKLGKPNFLTFQLKKPKLN